MASISPTPVTRPALSSPSPSPDDALLDDLYRERAPALTNWITGMTRDRAAAEDVVSEAFLRCGPVACHASDPVRQGRGALAVQVVEDGLVRRRRWG